MKILVTGSEGFIGKNFCRFAKRQGHEIVGFDKKIGKNILDLFPNRADRKTLQDVAIILHLAANCSSPRSFLNPEEDFLDNALGTLKTLELARQLKVPVLYTSTCKVFSAQTVNARKGMPVDENVSVMQGARIPYGTSKLTGELYAQEYQEIYGVPVIINRLSTVYGPDQDGSEEAGWLYWFVKAKKQKLEITIYGDGTQTRDCLWIDDLCSLLMEQMVRFKNFSGEVFNVGGGKENALSLIDAVAHLDKKGGPSLQIKYAPARPADFHIYISDMARLFSRTKWRPKTSVYTGIDHLYEII